MNPREKHPRLVGLVLKEYRTSGICFHDNHSERIPGALVMYPTQREWHRTSLVW